MPLPTGTATPWRQWEEATVGNGFATYLRDGHEPGASDYLAEQLRMDGLLPLGYALRSAETADLRFGWYGYVDGGDNEIECREDGETLSGETVDEVKPCVIATVHVNW